MLVQRGVAIAPASASLTALPRKTGKQVSRELGGRLLLRYVLATQVRSFTSGSTVRHWVTPTAYTPSEAVTYLALPDPDLNRPYVLVLDPMRIQLIWGPHEIEGSSAIEYVLPEGFPAEAIVGPGPGNAWALRIS